MDSTKEFVNSLQRECRKINRFSIIICTGIRDFRRQIRTYSPRLWYKRWRRTNSHKYRDKPHLFSRRKDRNQNRISILYETLISLNLFNNKKFPCHWPKERTKIDAASKTTIATSKSGRSMKIKWTTTSAELTKRSKPTPMAASSGSTSLKKSNN